MKILQINSVCGVGSTGRIATDLNEAILKSNYMSLIAHGRGPSKGAENVVRIGNNIDFYSHVISTRAFDNHGFASNKATRIFLDAVKEYNPDVIHLHNIHGYYINIELLFKYLKEADKPVVWTLHDCWAFTGHCAYFDLVGCEKWRTLCENCPNKTKYPKSYMMDRSSKNYIDKKKIFTGLKKLTIVTPSQWLQQLVKESFLGDYETLVIENGVDLDVFKPRNTEHIEKKLKIGDKFVVLGVANIWDERKGLDYFIELSKMLDETYQVIIVGLTDEQLKRLPSNVLGIKRTNSVEELAEIYTLADIFVNPTLEEVMGLTNVEALACGTPIITFRTGGSIETLDENSGYIVDKKNLSQLFDTIVESRRVPKKFEDCISRAKEFDKHKKYKQYVELYESVVDFKYDNI